MREFAVPRDRDLTENPTGYVIGRLRERVLEKELVNTPTQSLTRWVFPCVQSQDEIFCIHGYLAHLLQHSKVDYEMYCLRKKKNPVLYLYKLVSSHDVHISVHFNKLPNDDGQQQQHGR